MSAKYALVYWPDSKTQSVISTKDIPRRSIRENFTTKIKWQDITGVIQYHTAKVIKTRAYQYNAYQPETEHWNNPYWNGVETGNPYYTNL